MEGYPVKLRLADTRTCGNATLYVYEDVNRIMRPNGLWGRLGDWFAGLFAVGPSVSPP